MLHLSTVVRFECRDRLTRVAVALSVGIAAAVVARIFQDAEGIIRDFPLFWWSAKALTLGLDPYEVIGPSGSFFEWFAPHTYPLTAMLPIVPLTVLSPSAAMIVFVGVSAAALAYAFLRDGYQRLPVFFSWSFLFAITVGQWSPLMSAAALIPALGFILLVKPPIGFALFLFRPTKIAAVGCLILLAASFVVRPSWPIEWWESTMKVQSHFNVPVLVPGGQLLLLSLLRWKRADARLLLALSCVPHSLLPYEGVLLFLVATAWWEGLGLAALSWVMLVFWMQLGTPSTTGPERLELFARLMVVFMYLPALGLVLRRPNEGDTPELVKSLARVMRSPLRSSRPAET